MKNCIITLSTFAICSNFLPEASQYYIVVIDLVISCLPSPSVNWARLKDSTSGNTFSFIFFVKNSGSSPSSSN